MPLSLFFFAYFDNPDFPFFVEMLNFPLEST